MAARMSWNHRTSPWYLKGADVIRAAIAAGRAAKETPRQIRARADAAYPFGSRENWPYKCWLNARREVFATEGLTTSQAMRAAEARESKAAAAAQRAYDECPLFIRPTPPDQQQHIPGFTP